MLIRAGAVGRVGATAKLARLPLTGPFTNAVFDGDSYTGSGNLGQDSGSWAWQYLALKPAGTTAVVRAQGSRITGNLTMLDDGSNTLFGHLTENLTTYGGQLIWAGPFLANDFGADFHGTTPGAARAANIKARLAEYYGRVKSGGGKFVFGFTTPLRTGYSPSTGWYETRSAFIANFRDPAVWSQLCDYYTPVGEQPDFNSADNSLLIDAGDQVHPTTAGQAALLGVNRPVIDTLFDPARVSSTTMYSSQWPTGQTGLATSTQVTKRFIVSGLAHKGIALTGSNALSATNGGEVRVNGGTYAASQSGWLYNGDTIDLRVTSSASNNTTTSVALKVGTETRTLDFVTTAGGQVTYTHGDAEGLLTDTNVPSATHSYPSKSFASAGLAVIMVTTQDKNGPASLTVGGTSATKRAAQAGLFDGLSVEIWTAPLSSGGSKDIVLTYASAMFRSVVSWGVLTGANPVPSATAGQALNDGSPHSTGPFTVPAGGIALGGFAEYGSDPLTPAGVLSGTAVDEAQSPVRQGDRIGLSVAKRTDSGDLAWDFTYGPYPSVAAVFGP